MQEQLLSRMLKLIAAFSLVAFLPSAWLSVKSGLWLVLVLDVLACVLVAVLAFVPRLPFRLKTISLALLCYVLGAAILFMTGPFGAGHLFIFAFVFITALFGDIRTMLASNLLAIVTQAAIALASALHLVPWPQPVESVLVISVNFILISLVLSHAANFLIQGYARAVEEEERQRAMVERMLLELEHRVKNNLQVISSLIKLRFRSAGKSQSSLEEIKESLEAITMVHQLLYRRDSFYLIEIQTLLAALLGHYRKIHRGIAFELDWRGGEAEIDADYAVSLGILANEIITNALKHAFPDGRPGRITVSAQCQEDGHRLVLSIADNGAGFTEGTVPGTGSRIIHSLCEQLGSRMETETGDGVCYRLILDLPELRAR